MNLNETARLTAYTALITNSYAIRAFAVIPADLTLYPASLPYLRDFAGRFVTAKSKNTLITLKESRVCGVRNLGTFEGMGVPSLIFYLFCAVLSSAFRIFAVNFLNFSGIA